MAATIDYENGVPRLRELDWLMLAVMALCCLGIVMAVSVQSVDPDVGSSLQAMKGQGMKVVFGLFAFVVCAVVPLSLVRRYSWALFAVTVALVFWARLFERDLNGAHRWIWIGRQTFQPVEMARLALIILLAALIGRLGSRISEFREGFGSLMIPTGILALGLALQPDLGNALLATAIAVAMAIAAGVRIRWFLIAGLPILPLAIAAVTQRGYAVGRIVSFLSDNPPEQVQASILAISSGGLTGVGLGDGWMKMGFVPEVQNDFVFAAIGQELGFAGSCFVVALYTLIGIVGYRLVLKLHNPFYRYVVFGCTLAICLQALINLLVTTGMAPAKGIDLPMVSSGGSNLVASLGAIGLIGNAARADLADQG